MTNATNDVKPQGWTEAFAAKTEDAFGDAFAENVVLEATTLRVPVSGREDEWEATAFGGTELRGITVLRKNEARQIERVAIHHRPLDVLLTFSDKLGKLTDGLIAPGHFHELG
ncbi:nuclear transport factor 2 family protein [Actinomycetes bacterium M1A6_2h]